MLKRSFGLRKYMPTTFDETMVDFGFKVESNKFFMQLEDLMKRIDIAVKENKEVDSLCD